METWTHGKQENPQTHTTTEGFRSTKTIYLPTSAMNLKQQEPLKGCEGQNLSQDISQQVTGDAPDTTLALLVRQKAATHGG